MTHADLVCIGETLALISSTNIGPLSSTESMRLSVGGAESNVAIAASRLGTTAAWVGRVGKDSLGILVRERLQGAGLHLHIQEDPAPTALMVKERRTANLARVSYYRTHSAGANLQPSDIPAKVIAHAKVLHLSGITLALSESTSAAAFEAARIARENNVIVSFDVNYRSALWNPADAIDAIDRLLPHVDILFAGESEARMLVGETRNVPVTVGELASQLHTRGPREVIIKLGEHGALHSDGLETLHAPGVAVAVVDTVGAGDAFVGGYLAELIAGNLGPRRLETANMCGAMQCMTVGDWEGSPTRDDIDLMRATDPVSR